MGLLEAVLQQKAELKTPHVRLPGDLSSFTHRA